MKTCCQRHPPPPQPQPQVGSPPPPQGDERRTYVITEPMQIKIRKTTGTKYRAITCGEVAQARGRQVGTYTPCEKCNAVLRVPLGFEGLS